MNHHRLKKMIGIVYLFLLFPLMLYANTVDKAGAVVTDTVITTEIKAQFAKSPILSAFDIKVTTKKGVVYLSGLVDSTIQYQRALEIVADIKGVRKTDATNLNVKLSKQPQEDNAISLAVVAKLQKVGLITAINPSIAVEAENGVVYLDGYVTSKLDKKLAIETAKSVPGVRRTERRQ